MDASEATVTAEDWVKGVGYSILASLIGASSKLAIRKSWLIQKDIDMNAHHNEDGDSESHEEAYSYAHSEPEPEAATQRFTGTVGDDEVVRASSSHATMCLAYALRCLGLLGMTVFNPLCSVVAMNYASPSILAPFSGLTLVWIILFSKPIVGEVPSCNQVIACAFILVGEVVVAVFGDHTNDEGVTTDDVKQSYTKAPFLLYCVGLATWMFLLGRWIRSPPNRGLERFSWGVAGGSITGLQNFLKDALTVLKASTTVNVIIPPPFFFVLMLCAVCSALGGLLILTACMKRYDATYSAAMFVGSFVVSASIMSSLKYDTFQHLANFTDWLFYPFGLILLMIGVFLLARAGSPVETRDEESPVFLQVSEASPVDDQPANNNGTLATRPLD